MPGPPLYVGHKLAITCLFGSWANRGRASPCPDPMQVDKVPDVGLILGRDFGGTWEGVSAFSMREGPELLGSPMMFAFWCMRMPSALYQGWSV